MNEEFYFGDVVALIGCSEKYIVSSVNDLGEVYLEKVFELRVGFLGFSEARGHLQVRETWEMGLRSGQGV